MLKRRDKSNTDLDDHFRTLAELAPVGIAIADRDGYVRYCNPKFTDLFGFTPADMPTVDDWWTLAFPDARRRHRAVQAWQWAIAEARDEARDIGPLTASVACRSGAMRQIEFRIRATATADYVTFNDVTERQQTIRRLRDALAQLNTTVESIAQGLSRTLALRDPYTAEHQQRVAAIATAIAHALDLNADACREIYFGGLLHDIGKTCIPSEILCKPGRLSRPEIKLLQCHPDYSAQVLRGIAFPWPLWEIAAAHHERLDGSGYPRGLRGDAIPLKVRIISVADTLEAMLAHRPYRPAQSLTVAIDELKAGRGSRYDGTVVDACLGLLEAGTLPL